MSGYQKYRNADKLSVSLDLQGEIMRVGDLAWSRRENRAYFKFEQDFIDRGLRVSPFRLPLKAELAPAPMIPCGGLHGLFNDSLPDGWGRWLLDRLLRRHNFNKDELTAVDGLPEVGTRGMGALRYEPENRFPNPKTGDEIDLDWLASQADKVQQD